MGRLSKFLNAEEVVPYVQRQNGVPAGQVGGGGGKVYPEDVCVSMRECAFFWTGERREVAKSNRQKNVSSRLIVSFVGP